MKRIWFQTNNSMRTLDWRFFLIEREILFNLFCWVIEGGTWNRTPGWNKRNRSRDRSGETDPEIREVEIRPTKMTELTTLLTETNRAHDRDNFYSLETIRTELNWRNPRDDDDRKDTEEVRNKRWKWWIRRCNRWKIVARWKDTCRVIVKFRCC